MDKDLFEKKLILGKNKLSDNLKLTQNTDLISESNRKRIIYKKRKKCESIQQQKEILFSDINDYRDQFYRVKEKSISDIKNILHKFKRGNSQNYQISSQNLEITNSKFIILDQKVSTPNNNNYMKSTLNNPEKPSFLLTNENDNQLRKVSSKTFRSVLKNLFNNKSSFNIKTLDPLKYFSDKNSDNKKSNKKLYITNINEHSSVKVYNTLEHDIDPNIEIKDKSLNHNTLESNTISTNKKVKSIINSIDNSNLAHQNWKKKCYNLPYRKELECENLFVLENMKNNHRLHSRVESMRISMKSEEHYNKINLLSNILPKLKNK